MSLIGIVIVLAIIGVIIYAVEVLLEPYINATFRLLIRIVIVIAVLFWLLQTFGAFGPVIHFGR